MGRLKYENVLTEAQRDFIRDNGSPDLTAADLAKKFNEEFGKTFDIKKIERIRRRLIPGFGSNVSRFRRLEDMPQEQLDFLRRESVPQRRSSELAEMFNSRFGTAYKVTTIQRWRPRLVPGTSFNYPLGTESNTYGYIRVKVPGKTRWERWMPKQRLIWENQYGPCPDDHVVCFLDNDITNFDLDNLLAIKKKMLAFMIIMKIPKLALKVPGMSGTIAAMHQLAHQHSKIVRGRKDDEDRFKKLPPLYQPVGRPGFAY